MATTNFVDGTTIVVADWLNDVDAHAYNQQVAAHSAANISFSPVGTIAATDVQTAVAEVATDAATAITNLTATQVAYTPTGSVAATNVQTAIDEVVAETVQKTGDTGSAKMPAGTTAQRDGSPAAGWTRFNSTLVKNEYYNGTAWRTDGLVGSQTFATTSGTAFDFTGIPEWVTKLEVVLTNTSLSSTGAYLVQLGDAGGFVTTGYVQVAMQANAGGTAVSSATTGFVVFSNLSTQSTNATMSIYKPLSGNVYTASHLGSATAVVLAGGGSGTLTGPITQVRVTRTGADTFDAGFVTLYWS